MSTPYQVQRCQVLHSPMDVFVFHPPSTTDETTTPRPGIVLAQHIPVGHTGVENDTFTLVSAGRLASHGFVVAVPFIFHWWPKDASIDVKRAESRDAWMVADMQAAFDMLATDPDVDEQRIGVAGHCWGGRVAWLAACHNAQLKACAVFYGGRIKIAMTGTEPPGTHPTPIELAHKIKCPVAGFFGNDDANPSPTDVDDYSAALTSASIAHEFHRYDDAGHAFQNFPTAEKYRETQSEDAWSRVLSFFHQTL